MRICVEFTPREAEILLHWSDSVMRGGHWGDGDVAFPDESSAAETLKKIRSAGGPVLELFTRTKIDLFVHWTELHFKRPIEKLSFSNVEEKRLSEKLVQARKEFVLQVGAAEKIEREKADPERREDIAEAVAVVLEVSSHELDMVLQWSESTVKGGHWGDGDAVFPDEESLLNTLKALQRGECADLQKLSKTKVDLLVHWAERRFKSGIDRIGACNAEEKRLIEKLRVARAAGVGAVLHKVQPPPQPEARQAKPLEKEKTTPRARETKKNPPVKPVKEMETAAGISRMDESLDTVAFDRQDFDGAEEDCGIEAEDRNYREEET